MKYKLLVTSALFFTVSGYFLGTLFNNEPNTSIAVVILSFLNIVFITFMLVAFKMLKNQRSEGLKDGYKEGIDDIMAGVHEEYGEEGTDKVAKASRKILQIDGKVTNRGNKVHVHMHQ